MEDAATAVRDPNYTCDWCGRSSLKGTWGPGRITCPWCRRQAPSAALFNQVARDLGVGVVVRHTRCPLRTCELLGMHGFIVREKAPMWYFVRITLADGSSRIDDFRADTLEPCLA